jgi:hypothetical protein
MRLASRLASAELFVGGLPDHICIDIEMRDPYDLQMAMYCAHAYEQRTNAIQQAFSGCGARPPTRPALATATPTRPALPAAAAAAPVLELCPRGNNKDVIIIILIHDNVYIPC